MTPKGIGLIEYLAIGGTAQNTRVGANIGAVLPIGTTVIPILGLQSSGSISVGQTVKFQGDDNAYQVVAGLTDVSLGGTITIKPGLKSPQWRWRHIWTGGELRRPVRNGGPLLPTGNLLGRAPVLMRDWYDAGEVGQIWLDYRYARLDHNHKDFRSESVATAGVVQVQSFNTQERYILSQNRVKDLRGDGIVSDMAAIESFVDTAMLGGAFLWFPDYENYPDEYLSCVMNKRAEPTRLKNTSLFNFNFDVRVLPVIQLPSNIPGFI